MCGHMLVIITATFEYGLISELTRYTIQFAIIRTLNLFVHPQFPRK